MTAVQGEAQLTADVLRRAFGAHPTGVVAVSARVDGRLTGLVASSFTSVSLDPPLVSFSIANSSTTWPVLQHAREFGLGVLADHHGVICRQLSGPAERRFDGLDLHERGHAVHLADAVVQFDATLHAQVPAGDHTIVLLRLRGVYGLTDRAPLVFHRSGFTGVRDRKTALPRI